MKVAWTMLLIKSYLDSFILSGLPSSANNLLGFFSSLSSLKESSGFKIFFLTSLHAIVSRLKKRDKHNRWCSRVKILVLWWWFESWCTTVHQHCSLMHLIIKPLKCSRRWVQQCWVVGVGVVVVWLCQKMITTFINFNPNPVSVHSNYLANKLISGRKLKDMLKMESMM